MYTNPPRVDDGNSVSGRRPKVDPRYHKPADGGRLTIAQVRCIRERLTRGDVRVDIAADFRVSVATVGNIAVGIAWRGVK
ncbi:MAG: hypothetical protein H0V63_03350 [Burkholderiaceae bacterium]|nr:hypothetical protein [Burkholderiaceae bacterium]